jgi:PadR family transcriptional regulator, regulatory protein PadR
MSRREINNLVSNFARFYILTILYEGPTHGYDIMSKYQERVGKKISPGIVYPFLQKMDEQGYVLTEIEMIGEKERKIYYLTESGEKFTSQLFTRFAAIVSSALEPSMDTCAHCGCKIYEGVHVEEIDGNEMSFCCVHCANHYKHELMEQEVNQ